MNDREREKQRGVCLQACSLEESLQELSLKNEESQMKILSGYHLPGVH